MQLFDKPLRILIPTFVRLISVRLFRGSILYTVAALARRIPKLDKQDKRVRNLPAIFRTNHCKESGFWLVVRIYRFIIGNHKHMSLQVTKIF